MDSKQMVRSMFPWMAASFFITLLINGLGLIPAYLMSYIIDNVLGNSALPGLIGWVALYVGVPLVCGLLSIFYAYFTAVKCREVSYQINSRIMESLMFQNMLFHNQNTSSDLVTKTSQDTSDYAYLWVCTIPQSAAGIVVSVITFVLLLRMNWVIAVCMLPYILLLLLPKKLLGPVVKGNAGRLFGAIMRIRSQLTEAFSGIRMVKTMGLEGKMLSRYKDVFMGANQIFGKAVATETVTNQGVQEFIRAIFVGIAFIGSAVAVGHGNMTVGVLVSILSLLPSYFAGIVSTVNAGLSKDKLSGQYNEIFAYTKMPREDAEMGSKTAANLAQNSIAFSDVTFAYPDKPPVLNDFSAEIGVHQWTGIEGRSGFGKSTVLDLVLRLYTPESGKLLLDGKPANDYDLRWYRSKIAYVPQDPYLFTGTLRDNIKLFAPDCDEAGIAEALRIAQLSDWVSALPQGLDSVAGENGVSLSGGEKQRFALALALMSGREMLILDEATSNLDVASEQRIMEELAKLVKEQGLTILSVSHRKAFHDRCDRILDMEKMV